MKTAYELAMERLSKSAPSARLNPEQKRALADLDSRYAAKIAEREIFFHADMAKAQAGGDDEALEKARQQLASERGRLKTELEEKKELIRQGKG
jgi:hypothetical protein